MKEKKTVKKKAAKRSSKNKSKNKSEVIGVKKQYLKTGNVCNVTFRLPQEAAPDAAVVTVVGEFNDWNLSDTPMKKLKNGTFTTTMKLLCGNEYKFRYLIDSSRWENDWCADEYMSNAFGGEDSVIRI
jgi:1,4-alpha-glucan branching enzyme